MKLDLPRLSRKTSGFSGGPRTNKDVREAVKKYFTDLMDASTQEAVANALHDLYEGPDVEDEREGFETSVKKISRWWGDNSQDIWYDRDAGIVYDSKPGEEDMESSDIIEIDAADARQYVFGSELSKYIRRG